TKRLGRELAATMKRTNVEGMVLWDTMRKGSDSWRPGAFQTMAADHLRALHPNLDVSYAREDHPRPPNPLLKNSALTFRTSAAEYGRYLREDERLRIAAAGVVMAQASNRLATLCCVDPHVPGYADPAQFLSNIPYSARYWLPELPEEGCHRFILA